MNSETKRYNVIGPIGVMVVMHMATNALLTNIWAMSRDAAVMQVATKIKGRRQKNIFYSKAGRNGGGQGGGVSHLSPDHKYM